MKNNNLSLAILLSTLLIIVTTSTVYAQENMTNSKKSKLFTIQHAISSSISEINSTAYSLELNDVTDSTILFFDRPDRLVKPMSTSDFIGNWTTGEDSFTDDPPNAVLVVEESKVQDIVILTLFNPVYDSNKKTLKYEVTSDNSTSVNLQSEFGQSTLIIDPHVAWFGCP